MNATHEKIVPFRCSYLNCQNKVFQQVDTKGIFRIASGRVIWDLSSQVSIVYFPTCAYHAFDYCFSLNQNCEPQ